MAYTGRYFGVGCIQRELVRPVYRENWSAMYTEEGDPTCVQGESDPSLIQRQLIPHLYREKAIRHVYREKLRSRKRPKHPRVGLLSVKGANSQAKSK